MATKNDVLKALSQERDQEGQPLTVMPGPLAKKVGTTEGSLRSQLSSLKRDGYVEGNSTEGWIITKEGIDAVERGERLPTSAKDAGKDLPSMFNYYGKLHGVPPDLVLATLDIAESRDLENLEGVWDAMTEMGVEMTAKRRWFASWRNYLKQAIPPSLKEKVEGTTAGGKGEAGSETPTTGGKPGRDYIIVDDLPVFVGAGQGDYTMQDAKDLLNIRAIKSRFTGGSGAGGQQWGAADIVSLIDKVREKGGNGGAAKVYAVDQTEQGVVLREVTPNTPLNLNPPGGTKPPAMYIVDSEGVIQEMKPGVRVGSKPAGSDSGPKKITVVRQTDQGLVKETFDAGETIVLNNPAPGAGSSPVLPFPVFDKDNKPVLDSQGRPVYANLEPMLKWLGFEAEQRRSDQRHGALMGLVQTVRENVPSGIAALRAAAEEARKEKAGTSSAAAQPQIYECGECKTQFTIPPQDFEKVGCPKCGHIYTRQEVLG